MGWAERQFIEVCRLKAGCGRSACPVWEGGGALCAPPILIGRQGCLRYIRRGCRLLQIISGRGRSGRIGCVAIGEIEHTVDRRVGEDGDPVRQVRGGLDDIALIVLARERKLNCPLTWGPTVSTIGGGSTVWPRLQRTGLSPKAFTAEIT